MLYNIILSLISTLFIELIISIFCGINEKNNLLCIFLINLFTNPITELINLLIISSRFHYPIILFIEILVIFIEFILYKKFLKVKKINLLYLSIINNVCSYIIGIIFNLYLGGIIWKIL